METGNSIYTQFIAEVEEYAIITMDESGGIKSWNKGAEKMKGYQPGEIIGKNFRVFYTGEDKKNGLPERLMREAATNGKTTSQGWRVRKNGDLFWSEVCITAVYDSERKLIGYTKILHPVASGEKGQLTEPMTNRERDEFDHNNLQALINNTHDLMWSVDRNYRLITSNAAFDKLMCKLNGDIIEKGGYIFPKAFPQEQLRHYKKLYDRAFAGEIFKVTEYADAAVALWSELSFYPIYEGTEVVGTACYSHNISEIKKADEKVRKSEANLRTLFENSTETFLLTDRDGIIITFNTLAQKIAKNANGVDLTVGGNIIDLVPGERRTSFKEMLARAANGETVQYNHSFTGHEGLYHYFDFTINPVYDNGVLTGTCINGREVTERHLAAEKMERDEKRYQALVENGNDAVVILSEDFKPVHVSPSIQRVLGYTANEALELDVFTIAHPEDVIPSQEALERAMANPGIPIKGHTGRMRHKDGTWHWYESTVTNMLHDPAIRGFIDNFRDVTEKKRLEDRLAEERKIFSDLFLQAPSYICMLRGPEHIYEMANPPYLQVTGKGDIIGMKAVDVFPELVEQGYAMLLDTVYNTGEPFTASEAFIQINADGSGKLTDHYMNFVYQPYRNLDGKIDGIFFFANVVTEQVEARRKVEQREQHFRALIENAGDIISLADKNGTITYASPAMERVTGYKMDEIIGRTYFSMLHPDSIPEAIDFYSTLLSRPGELIERTNRYVHRDGSDIWVEGTVINLLEDANVRAILGNFRDITSRKLAEERVLNVNRLYAFISGINQAIVHATDEQTIFQEVCRIAVEVGKFKTAWVGTFERQQPTISLVEASGLTAEEVLLFKNVACLKDGPQERVRETGKYFLSNDTATDVKLGSLLPAIEMLGIRSCILMPLRKSGIVMGTLNLYSSEVDLFDPEEIRLLEEIAMDISFVLDVFEKEKHRKYAEQGLNYSKQRLKQAQAIAHVGSWDMSLADGVATWSEESCRIYGLSPDENEQSFDNWLSFVHPEDLPHVLEKIGTSGEQKSSYSFYHRILRRDGEIRYIFSEAHFEFDDSGIPTGMYGVAHDVTEIRKAEEALAKSEANLRMIMDLIPQSIFVKNGDGKFLFSNKSFAEIYGLTPADVVNYTEIRGISDAERLMFMEQDRAMILAGEPVILPESVYTDEDQKTRIFHSVKVPFTMAGTNEKAVLGILHDITLQKEAEAERAKIIQDMLNRNNDLEQFSYIVSHNLRAPVANILGLLDIINTIGINESDEQEVLGYLATAATNLDNVIRDINYILDLKHDINEKKERISFAKLLEEIRMSITNVIHDQHVILKSDFSAVPGMNTVKSYLYSIFTNLISNSIKYRRPDVDPVIEIRTFMDNGNLHISVKDNGLGIDLEKESQSVFGLYKRFHFHVEGKGMGLFMVKTQVETLGGKISVSSEVNKGTEFNIEFELSENF